MPINGPEDLPIREGFVKNFPMMILIRNLKDDVVIRRELINYGKHEDRQWLGRITYYCCTNKLSVETMSEGDFKTFEE